MSSDLDDLARILTYAGAIDDATGVTELGPDVLVVPFWTPAFCAAVVRAAELVGFAPDPDDPVPGHDPVAHDREGSAADRSEPAVEERAPIGREDRPVVGGDRVDADVLDGRQARRSGAAAPALVADVPADEHESRPGVVGLLGRGAVQADHPIAGQLEGA